MFRTERETLEFLADLANKNLGEFRSWFVDFLTRGSPYKVPWPDRDEPSAARRLQLLCDAPISDPPLRAVQDLLRDEVLSLCEQYNGRRYSVRCGLELLDFVHANFSRRGALAFNQKLIDASLPWREVDGRWIWVEAHRVVSEILAGDWPVMKPWVIRDARLGDARHHRDDPLRLRVAISALGVWARQGPMNTLPELLELITCALLHLRRLAQDSSEDACMLIVPRERDLQRHVRSIVDRVGTDHADSFSKALKLVFDECATARFLWRASLDDLDRVDLLPDIPAHHHLSEDDRWRRTAAAVEQRVYKLPSP